VLRPGGLVELLEYDFRFYDKHHRPISPPTTSMEPPWLPRWMNFLSIAIRQRGGSVDAANMLYSWVSEHGAFEDVHYQEIYFPTAPFGHPKDPDYHRLQAIASIMREDMQVGSVGPV